MCVYNQRENDKTGDYSLTARVRIRCISAAEKFTYCNKLIGVFLYEQQSLANVRVLCVVTKWN